MKIPGVIGGLAPQSTELFYDEFLKHCKKRVGGINPNIIISSIDLWRFLKLLQDKEEELKYIEEEIGRIQNDVDFIALVCNTVHYIIKDLREDIKVPIIAIHEEVCQAVAKEGVKRAGILGTKTTVEGNFYQLELMKHNIAPEVLDADDEEILNEPRLKKEADDLIMKASQLYHEAMKHQSQKKRDELLDKAMPICDQAIQKLYKIADYYEEHNIQHKKGGIWDWEKTLKDASQLAYDIQKAHGF